MSGSKETCGASQLRGGRGALLRMEWGRERGAAVGRVGEIGRGAAVGRVSRRAWASRRCKEWAKVFYDGKLFPVGCDTRSQGGDGL